MNHPKKITVELNINQKSTLNSTIQHKSTTKHKSKITIELNNST